VQAPPEWLDRLAGVLVDNACRYSRAGGEVAVEVTTHSGHPRMAVLDTGPGVPAADRQRIFNRFHRGLEEGEGAGLGLAIADAVVKATGARWEIANRTNGGAEFAVVWPRGRRVSPVAAEASASTTGLATPSAP
jgi:signal transduction histidine kinase